MLPKRYASLAFYFASVLLGLLVVRLFFFESGNADSDVIQKQLRDGPLPNPVDNTVQHPIEVPVEGLKVADDTPIQSEPASDPVVNTCEEVICPANGMPPVLVTVVATGQMQYLRELVGSVHHQRHDNLNVPLFVVYGFNMSAKDMAEIRLWRNVDFVDANHDLALATSMEGVHRGPGAKDDGHAKIEKGASLMYAPLRLDRNNPLLVLNLLDINIQKHGAAIFIDLKLQFSSNKALNFIVGELNLNDVVLGRERSTDRFVTGLPVLGARVHTSSYRNYIKFPLQCARGYQCPAAYRKRLFETLEDDALIVNITQHGLIQQPKKDGTNFCHILLRDDVLYAFDLVDPLHGGAVNGKSGELFSSLDIMGSDRDLSIEDNNDDSLSSSPSKEADAADNESAARKTTRSTESPSDSEQTTALSESSSTKAIDNNSTDGSSNSNSGKLRIAVGMPTISVGGHSNFMDLAPFKLFVPTFLKSVTADEWKRYEYIIYIGYDQGDAFWDNPDHLPQMDAKLKQMVADYPVQFEYVRFPFSKGWVTFIWNGLFVHAMRDGCDYFFQVNDDLTLDSTGWTDLLVNTLVRNNNVGVAGPKDKRHNRLLLTQAFTHRTHFEIFGRFYPLDLKDWFSDDWISNVYGSKGTFEVQDIRITNTQYKGTRYVICRKPNYDNVLERGKGILEAWKRAEDPLVLFQ